MEYAGYLLSFVLFLYIVFSVRHLREEAKKGSQYVYPYKVLTYGKDAKEDEVEFIRIKIDN